MPKRSRVQLEAPESAPLVGADNVERRLIALTMSEAERRIRDHSASDSMLVHFLKLGSTRTELETARLLRETALLEARTTALKSQSTSEDGYQNVIDAILGYRGTTFDEDVL